MDCLKIGQIIRQLRKEKNMTQSTLAKELNISDKTISKWERGMGCPDISLIVELSEILGVDLNHMLKGHVENSPLIGGNLKKSQYHVCSLCGNVTMSTGATQVTCCGRKIEALVAQKAAEDQKLNVEVDGDEFYITSSHASTKENYISFIVYALGGAMELIKQYPEWDIQLRLQRKGRGKLLWYSTKLGLLYQNI